MTEGGRDVPEMHRVVSRKPLTAPQATVEIVEALEGLPLDRATAVADYMSRLPDASIPGSNIAAPANVR